MDCRRGWSWGWVVCLPLWASFAGAEVVTIDLAGEEKSGERSIEAGTVEVKLINALPNAHYDIAWKLERVPREPLEFQGLRTTLTTPVAACDDLRAALKVEPSVGDESEVPAYLNRFRAAGMACKVGGPDEFIGLKDYYQDRLTSFERAAVQLGNRGVKMGERITIYVYRSGDGLEPKSWVRVFDAPVAGRWLATYGFAFAEDGDDRFFTQEVEGEEGKFQIQRKQDNEDLDFVPGIFYTWLPTALQGTTWGFGYSAGLGYDGSEVNLFAGAAVALADNVLLQVGALVHRESRLNGKYDGANLPVLGEELSEDQLVEKTYTAAPFVAVSFRFGTNPFEKGSTGKKAEEKPSNGSDEEPAPKPADSDEEKPDDE